MTIQHLFESHFIKTDGCWLWRDSKDTCGYGLISRNGYSRRAHRMSWEIYKGPIPQGLNVLHHCDVPACVNPDHLFLGTQADNMKDMTAKGRNKFVAHYGKDNGATKLDWNSVRQIRRLWKTGGISKSALARQFRVDVKNIRVILANKTWKEAA